MSTAHLFVAVPLLAIASCYDVAARRIPNLATVAVAVSGVAAAWHMGGLTGVGKSVAAAAIVFAALLFAWRARMLGGGDLKLAVGCAAWAGYDALVPWLCAAAVAGGAISLVCWALSSPGVRRDIVANLRLASRRAMPPVTIKHARGRVSVPYGAAFAVATMWIFTRS